MAIAATNFSALPPADEHAGKIAIVANNEGYLAGMAVEP